MIEISALSKSFGTKKVFKDYSAQIETGKATFILGPSGCGKTTLLRLLCSLEKPDFGSVIGLESETFSFVFQEDRLIPTLTALENVLFVGADPMNAARLLDAVGLKNEKDALPSSLSGGMKRRIALARALAKPGFSVLFLDEPFTGLDEKTAENIRSLLKAETQGKTVIAVTNNEADAKTLADAVLRIDHIAEN